MREKTQARYHARASNDIDEHALYIAGDELDAGLRFLNSVHESFDELVRHPEIGVARHFDSPILSGLRVWPVRHFENWLIFYRIGRTELTALRILHASRDLPSALEE